MRYLLAGVLVVVAAAVLTVLVSLQPLPSGHTGHIHGPGANGRRYERLQLGMTEQQAEAILGGPRGFYDGKEHNEPLSMSLPIGFDDPDGGRSGVWYFDDCAVTVSFDRAGKADMKELEVGRNLVDITVPPPTLADKLSRAWQWACRLPH